MQKTEQGQPALLNIRKLYSLSQLSPKKLGTAYMMLRITVTFLERPDQRGKHFGMNGFMIKKFFCAHGFFCHMDSLKHTRHFLRDSTDRVLYFTVKMFFHQINTLLHFHFIAVAAHRNEICIQSPHIIGLFWEIAAHSIRKQSDFLVSHIVSQRIVDHRQAVYITDHHPCRASKILSLFLSKPLETLPVLKSCQQIGFQSCI